MHLRGSRRKLITGAGAVGAGAIAVFALDACSADGSGMGGEDAAAQTADVLSLKDFDSAADIWDAMLDGNQRWADGGAVHPDTDVALRESLAEGQEPRAAVFTCVDSRVAPEFVFDTGIGDLMVTRTAGNVYDPLVSESVSYGPAALEAPLLVVLGHQKCGAVTAAHEALLAAEEGTELEEHEYALPETVEALRAAYEASKGESGDPVDAMIKANVLLTVQALKEHPNLAELVADGELTVVGGVYSLETGLVTEVA
ncbi:carbonic anhydrase [Glycomyces algeriensis]|uniref:Carbonic anhydrase n=1 Tax=Glycomyces algeriensis TaxID=256037 RepID=A0A9W6LGK8_9ACTN|nr:carbonic anhydrase [Glycomyces algeriensis]